MKTRKILIILSVIATGIVILFVMLNIYVKQKVKTEISGIKPPITYKELGINIITNKFSLSEVSTQRETFGITAKKVQFSGLSYYNFFFHDRLDIDQIRLEEPSIRYSPGDSLPKETTQNRHFSVGSVLLKNGNFTRKDSDTSKVDLFVNFPEVEIEGIESSKGMKFKSYKMDLDSVYVKMDSQHFIQIGNAEAESGRVEFLNFRIVPLDSKNMFDQKIPYEKDRISLQIKNISLEDFAFKEIRDTLFLKQSKMTISDAFLEIYRNKLVRDDVRKKVLYSELLRKAPVKLNFKQVLVENSEIIYEEQVKESREPAVIRFTNVSAEIKNLHNLTSEEIPQPEIGAKGIFMTGTPIHLTWTFPVFDLNNRFNISGNFGALEAEALDPFLVPGLDLQARGKINDIKFNFSGNENLLVGDFNMDYDNLKVELLKDNGKKKKNFFSAIANLFVNNDGKQRAEEEEIEVERDKQRSFWNYIWLGLREGLLKTVSQL